MGSVKTRLRDAAGICLRTSAACSALVTVQIRSGGISGRSRATVCSSMVFLPTMLSNCLGVRVRLRGQNRVPRPPARITAWVCSFSVGIGRKNLTQRLPWAQSSPRAREETVHEGGSAGLLEDHPGELLVREARVIQLLRKTREIGDIGMDERGALCRAKFIHAHSRGNEPALARIVIGGAIREVQRAVAGKYGQQIETRVMA